VTTLTTVELGISVALGLMMVCVVVAIWREAHSDKPELPPEDRY
jgi:hypothetical protein